MAFLVVEITALLKVKFGPASVQVVLVGGVKTVSFFEFVFALNLTNL